MDYARLLAEGVGAWLQFEYACDRSSLFSEKYLCHPIGQILSSRTGNRAHAEYKHPILAPLSIGAGRRPEIDFVVFENYPKISIAVESKWIGETKPSVKSILWDLIRLELIAQNYKARCFFVLGGKRSDLEAFFALKTFSGASNSGQPRPLLLHTRNILHKIHLVPKDTSRIPLLKSLFESYQDMKFPHTIISRRSGPFPEGQPGKNPQVYVWEILPAHNRETFCPKNSAHYSLSGKSRRDKYRASKTAIN